MEEKVSTTMAQRESRTSSIAYKHGKLPNNNDDVVSGGKKRGKLLTHALLLSAVEKFEANGEHVFPYPHHSVACAIAREVNERCSGSGSLGGTASEQHDQTVRSKYVKAFVTQERNRRRRRTASTQSNTTEMREVVLSSSTSTPPEREQQRAAFFYFVLHKPAGFSSMRDPTGFAGRHPSCYSLLPQDKFPHVPHVGRLDVDTEGLLLFTDDGRLNDALIGGDTNTIHDGADCGDGGGGGGHSNESDTARGEHRHSLANEASVKSIAGRTSGREAAAVVAAAAAGTATAKQNTIKRRRRRKRVTKIYLVEVLSLIHI